MGRYAEGTEVSTERSKSEIEKTLRRYGADQFISGWSATAAMIGFSMRGRQVKFHLPMPDPEDREFTHTATGRKRKTSSAMLEAYEQATRQRWRALALCIKAKLEAVEAGITTFEDEFLAHTVLPDGRTAGEFMVPQVAAAYASGTMPELLPMIEGPANG